MDLNESTKNLLECLVAIGVLLCILQGSIYAWNNFETEKTYYEVEGAAVSSIDAESDKVIQYEDLSEKTQDQFREAAASKRDQITTKELKGIQYVKLDGMYYPVGSESMSTVTSLFIGLTAVLSGTFIVAFFFATLHNWEEFQIDHHIPIPENVFQIGTGGVSLLVGIYSYIQLWQSFTPIIRVIETSQNATVSASTFGYFERTQLMNAIATGKVKDASELAKYAGGYVQTNGEVYHLVEVAGIVPRLVYTPWWSLATILTSIIITIVVWAILNASFGGFLKEEGAEWPKPEESK